MENTAIQPINRLKKIRDQWINSRKIPMRSRGGVGSLDVNGRNDEAAPERRDQPEVNSSGCWWRPNFDVAIWVIAFHLYYLLRKYPNGIICMFFFHITLWLCNLSIYTIMSVTRLIFFNCQITRRMPIKTIIIQLAYIFRLLIGSYKWLEGNNIKRVNIWFS